MKSFNLLNLMDCLVDELLCDILCRLPCTKSAFRALVVCKRWRALLSSPHFIRAFVKHHTGTTTVNPSLAFIATPRIFGQDEGHILSMRDTESGSNLEGGFWSVFLPDFFAEIGLLSSAPVKVVATCQDLVLCSTMVETGEEHDFFICNPQTMHWVILPRPPSLCDIIVCGLASVPDHNNNDNKPANVVNGPFKYRVVIADSYEVVQVFDSEIRKWQKVKLLSSKPVKFVVPSPGLFFDDMLYFHCTGGIIAFNPFMSEEGDDDVNNNGGAICVRSHFIDWPTDRNLVGIKTNIGICDRSLWMTMIEPIYRIVPGRDLRAYMYKWKLKDYRTSDW